MGRITLNFLALAGLILGLSSPVLADDASPDCFDGSKALDIDNVKVLNWIEKTKDDFLGRARIEGRIVKILPDKTKHTHFLMQIGPNKDDVIQAVYNQKFGDLPALALGQNVEACGDYITTRDGPKLHADAIIHWVHASTNLKKHASGYLKIDGLVYGLELPQQSSGHH